MKKHKWVLAFTVIVAALIGAALLGGEEEPGVARDGWTTVVTGHSFFHHKKLSPCITATCTHRDAACAVFNPQNPDKNYARCGPTYTPPGYPWKCQVMNRIPVWPLGCLIIYQEYFSSGYAEITRIKRWFGFTHGEPDYCLRSMGCR